MTALRTIPGPTAILVAETFSVQLYKYNDSTGHARSKLSTKEARSLVKQAPKLIHVDTGDVADAIEDSQIRALKRKALSASDSDQVDVCDQALGNESAVDLTREEARIACAITIAEARAQGDLTASSDS